MKITVTKKEEIEVDVPVKVTMEFENPSYRYTAGEEVEMLGGVYKVTHVQYIRSGGVPTHYLNVPCNCTVTFFKVNKAVNYD